MARPKPKSKMSSKAKSAAKKKAKAQKSAHATKMRNMFLVALAGVVAAIIFLPTTVLLLIGMMPTLVAYVVDATKEKLLLFIVGFMNLAGCVPFILKLWAGGHNMVQMSDIISQPLTVVIIYACAGVGYFVDWIVTDAASSFITRRAKARSKAIVKQQAVLVERWGPEVNAAHIPDGGDGGEE